MRLFFVMNMFKYYLSFYISLLFLSFGFLFLAILVLFIDILNFDVPLIYQGIVGIYNYYFLGSVIYDYMRLRHFYK